MIDLRDAKEIADFFMLGEAFLITECCFPYIPGYTKNDAHIA